MKKLLVVDGNSIVNRAFYGIRLLTNRNGLFTNALYGMTNIIYKQIDVIKPDMVAVAFDLKDPTFRHKMYDQYKAGRKPMPDELAVQMPYARKLVKALGIKVVEVSGYEADDILGTLSLMNEKNGGESYVLTGDRDSLQLISDKTTILLATNTDTIKYDEKMFFEKYGVNSSQFVDVKALMGDSSDNIPGVAGIGEKTALSLISQFGNIEKIYENVPNDTLSPSVNRKLTDGKDNAFFSKKLATIYREVPLDFTLDDILYGGVDKEEAYKLFTELEFTAFIKRFGLSSGDVPTDIKVDAVKEDTKKSYRIPEFKKENSSVLKDISTASTIAVSFFDDTMFVFNEEVAIFVPLDDNAEQFLGDARRRFCLYDCKSLYHSTYPIKNCHFDVMLAAYVLDATEGSFSLERLVAKYLGIVKEESIPDAYYIFMLYNELKAKIYDEHYEKLFFDIEMPLSKVLYEMEDYGFKIDREGLINYGDKLDSYTRKLTNEIYTECGRNFNINSPKQLGEVLFEDLNLPHGKKTKTGYSTNAEVLQKLAFAYPVVAKILEYRQVTKLKGTYIDGFLKLLGMDDVIHTTFKQTGTATGRLSSAEPNLQNIPIRSELGRELRHFFVPRHSNNILIDADYSQIELRLLAAISNDSNMISAFKNGVDIHTSTASAVFGVPIDEVTPEMRKRAKAVNFGIVYGIGGFSLADDLNISMKQANEYIESYLATYPNIDKYLKNVIKEGYDNGYVSTLFGRRRYIPELLGQNKTLKKFGERVAMNSPIQGTAADIIKIAMVNVSKRLKLEGLDAKLILQVHDELLIEASEKDAEKASAVLREEMENAVDMSVKLLVELTVGKTWFDNK